MRKMLPLAVAVPLLWGLPSAANPITLTPWGAVDLYADAHGWDELIVDTAPGLLYVYVVHTGDPYGGAAACQYSAPKPACLTAVYLSDFNVFPVTVGNSQTGVSIGYGTCRQYPIHVQTISYFGQGMTTCCYYPVLPDPHEPSGRVVAVDCNQQLVAVTGGATVVNFTQGCYSVPAEETSWGRVKSLYAE